MSSFYSSKRISFRNILRTENYQSGEPFTCELCENKVTRVGRKPAKYCKECLDKIQQEYKESK